MEIKIHSQCGKTEERMQGIEGVGCPWDGSEQSSGMASRLAVAAISGYQRYISPYKGFRCAHRVLHGGDSCSQFIKRLVERKGLLGALKEAPGRFRACGMAYRILRAESDEDVPWYRQSMLSKPKKPSGDPGFDITGCLEGIPLSCCCDAASVLPCSLVW
jgi:putative component of membrane protein insertase Oxa1/YidC/SpoIIIJ protein YidD